MNQAVSSSFVAFHVGTASILAPSGEPITLFSLPTNARLVRVPTFLELYLSNTDTAYTVGPSIAEGSSAQEDFQPTPGNYAEQFGGGRFLYIIDSTGRLFFRVPLVGFVDQLTEQKRLAMALTNGAVFESGGISFKLKFGTTVTLGDGDLYGRLHFDEYALYS